MEVSSGNRLTPHLTVGETLAFVERNGYALLFLWVLAEQSAIPLPSAPLLLAAGALVRDGRLHASLAVACCVGAVLIGDTIWFLLGRRRGRRVLGFLCRVSLEPDSCVRQTENALLKYGLRTLLISKFIPGLNAVAAPLAGHSKFPYARFLVFDIAGGALWSGAYLALGYLFSTQLESILAYSSRMGAGLLLLISALLVLWIARKFVQRRMFLRRLRGDRITAAELQERLNAGEELVIVDLRTGAPDSQSSIPGAIRMSPTELTSRRGELPRDREIILFCS
jgi:membrane protein DedA with SNARE-associated domain